jgi:hypothetical protein
MDGQTPHDSAPYFGKEAIMTLTYSVFAPLKIAHHGRRISELGNRAPRAVKGWPARFRELPRMSPTGAAAKGH